MEEGDKENRKSIIFEVQIVVHKNLLPHVIPPMFAGGLSLVSASVE